MKSIVLVIGTVGLLTVSAVAEITAVGQAGPGGVAALTDQGQVVWDNIPIGNPGNRLFSSQRDIAFPFLSMTADDFILVDNFVITEVHWWGGWWAPGPPGNATAFEIHFFNDDNGKPAGSGLLDPSSEAIESYTIPIDDITVTPVEAIEQYVCYLPSGVGLLANQRYWIAIVSVNTFPPQWGIADAGVNQRLIGAHQGFPRLGRNFWTAIDPYPTDMAFRLLNPEPTSLLLVGLAGVFLLRRR